MEAGGSRTVFSSYISTGKSLRSSSVADENVTTVQASKSHPGS